MTSCSVWAQQLKSVTSDIRIPMIMLVPPSLRTRLTRSFAAPYSSIIHKKKLRYILLCEGPPLTWYLGQRAVTSLSMMLLSLSSSQLWKLGGEHGLDFFLNHVTIIWRVLLQSLSKLYCGSATSISHLKPMSFTMVKGWLSVAIISAITLSMFLDFLSVFFNFVRWWPNICVRVDWMVLVAVVVIFPVRPDKARYGVLLDATTCSWCFWCFRAKLLHFLHIAVPGGCSVKCSQTTLFGRLFCPGVCY